MFGWYGFGGPPSSHLFTWMVFGSQTGTMLQDAINGPSGVASRQMVCVSKNRGGPPKSSILYNRIFHYKPSILGNPKFLETPIFVSTIKYTPAK